MWGIPNIDIILGDMINKADYADISVSNHDARFRTNGKTVHSCNVPLPAGAIKTKDGKKVASPELLFLELACKLDIHRLILLGLQLCSHPPGLPAAAITTKQKLTTFLSKTAKHRGHRKAIRAVKYIENGSASIMESLSYILLALPHALGGYVLNGVTFNYEITLKNDAQVQLGQYRCFADLYYRQAKVAVEYDSFTYHNTPSEQGKDNLRSSLLERQGIDVMHFSTIQLYNNDACRDFAYNLAARLGKRIQIRTNKFDEMHALIRELLPDRKSTITCI
jgi:very-short-patch-repair endonuclease